MNRYLLMLSLILMIVIAFGQTHAQRQSQSPPAPPGGDDLQETVEWLGVQLKRYGRMTLAHTSYPGMFDRTSFDGMRVDGCKITYRIKLVRSYPPTSDPMQFSPGGASYSEYEVDLKSLEPSLVRAERPKGWRGGRVTFGAGRGRVAVTRRGKGGKVMTYDGGEFYVSEVAALDVIAEALRRAIIMCRE